MNRDAAAREVLLPRRAPELVKPFASSVQAAETPPERGKAGPKGHWPGKRMVDVVGVLILLAILSPVIVGVVVCLLRSGGPMVFRHERIGVGGRPFKCYKFVTMVQNADAVLSELLRTRPDLREEWRRDHKLRNDPRVTPVGAFLRRTSLDELPQLWNVLKGDMSLVGPLPIVQEETVKYGSALRHYFAMRPGLTGLWQVSGRNDTAYRRRVAMDRAYVRHASFTFDLWILLRTVGVVLFPRGAY